MKSEKRRTIDLKPFPGEMIKPAELVDICGAGGLSLYASKVYNILLNNAFGPEMGKQGEDFSIRLADLRGLHESNDRIGPTLESLQKTIVKARLSDGRMRQVQLLGGVDFDDDDRPDGVLNYSFDKRLVTLLRQSSIFAKLELKVIANFSSKYALALYEAVCRRVNMRECVQEFTLEEFREILRVEDGKLTGFAQLNQWAIQPALLEVNGLADFEVRLMPRKRGKKVVSIILAWGRKDFHGQREAFDELNRSRIGRKARLKGTVETITTDDGTETVPRRVRKLS
jgi:hypothetical protein